MSGATRREMLLASLSALAFALVLGLVSLGGNVRAAFGPIDDHEPLDWLGSDGRLGIGEVLPTLFGDTEVGRFGSTPRFRPSYYLVRLLQTTAFGEDARLWYASVGVLFVCTIAILGLVTWMWMRRAFDPSSNVTRVSMCLVAPLLGVLLFGTMPAWSGVATRLGPSELLAMFGVSLVAVGTTQLAHYASSWWWIPTIAGVFTAVWSKENFLPLSAIVAGVGLFRFASGGRSRANLGFSLLALVPSGVMVLALAGVAGGKDVYGAQVGAGRFGSALAALFGTYRWYWIPAVIVVILAAAIWTVTVWRGARPQVLLVWWVVGVGFGWLVFDAWVYSGVYTLPRYWMVFQFLKVIAIIGALALSLAAWSAAGSRLARRTAAAVGVAAAILAVVQVSAAPASVASIRATVENNVVATATWQSGVAETLVQMSNDNTSDAVIVVSHPVDFEPVIALAGEIQRRSPDARVAVDTAFTAEQATSTLGAALVAMSADGLPDRGIVPLGIVRQDDSAVCAFLNSSPRVVQGCSPTSSVRVDAQAM